METASFGAWVRRRRVTLDLTQAELARLGQAGWKESGTPLEAAVREYVVNYLVPGAYLSATSA